MSFAVLLVTWAQFRPQGTWPLFGLGLEPGSSGFGALQVFLQHFSVTHQHKKKENSGFKPFLLVPPTSARLKESSLGNRAEGNASPAEAGDHQTNQTFLLLVYRSPSTPDTKHRGSPGVSLPS